jgi:flagellar biogenesis protein FliO
MGESAYLLHVCLVTEPNHTQAQKNFFTVVIKLQIVIIIIIITSFYLYF